jgi:hypothetical protein
MASMRILHDFQGLAIRLTDERLAHVLEHPELAGMESAITETLRHPEQVVQSVTAYVTDKIKRGVQTWPREG